LYDDKKQKTSMSATRDGKERKIKSPHAYPADGKKIEDFLSNLRSLHANDIVSEDANVDAKKYGFDRPYAMFTVKFSTDDGVQERTIWIGNKFGGEKDVYIRRRDFPQVYTVRSSLKSTLTLKLQDIVDKTPFHFDKDSITSLVSKKGEETTFELTKKDDKWTLAKLIQDAANQLKVSSLLSKLVDLKAEEFLGERSSPGLGGLILSLRVNAGKAGREIAFYSGKEEKDAIGKTSDPVLFYRFEKKKVGEIADLIPDLRDRRILPIEKTDLSSITFRKDDLKATFTKTKEDKWVLGSFEGGDPSLKAKLRDGSPVDEILRIVDEASLTSFVDGLNVDEKEKGTIFLEFRPKQGEAVSWLFGKQEGEGRLIRSKERKVTGKISVDKIEPIENIFALDKKDKG